MVPEYSNILKPDLQLFLLVFSKLHFDSCILSPLNTTTPASKVWSYEQ